MQVSGKVAVAHILQSPSQRVLNNSTNDVVRQACPELAEVAHHERTVTCNPFILRTCEDFALNVARLSHSGESRNPVKLFHIPVLYISGITSLGSGLRRSDEGEFICSQALSLSKDEFGRIYKLLNRL